MGLLQYIYLHYENNDSFSSIKQNAGGLYNKALKILASIDVIKDKNVSDAVEDTIESIDQTHFPTDLTFSFFSFHDFVDDNNIQKSGILVPYKNFYKILFSKGLSEETYEQSYSSFDFWDGTIKDNEWLSYKDSELAPFYQLFSSNDLCQSDTLNIKKYSIDEKTDIIFFVITQESKLHLQTLDTFISSMKDSLLENIIPFLPYSFIKINKDICITENNAYVLTLSMKDFFDNEFSLFEKSEQDYIIFHLFRKIKKAITDKNICILTNNNEIKLALFNSDEDDAQMILIQITKIITDYLNSSSTFNFSIINESQKNSIDEIKSFFTQDE